MAFVINKHMSFEALEREAVHHFVLCDDPLHTHQNSILESYAVVYRGHRVSMVIDGDWHSVQIDRDSRKMRENVSREAAINFIEEMTNKE